MTKDKDPEYLFSEWFFTNFDKLPSFYAEEGTWDTETHAKFRERFATNSILQKKFRPTIWFFYHKWKNYGLKISVFVDRKGKGRLSAEVYDDRTEKKTYLSSNPLDFIEDLEQRYKTFSNAAKFGL